MKSAFYKIRIDGCLDPSWQDWFGELQITTETHAGQSQTVLSGQLDQAALHGVLIKIRDLGLDLVSVTQPG